MKKYPIGNPELLAMIHARHFDEQKANRLITGIDLNQPVSILSSSSYYSTTYLHEAVDSNNLQAVSFLLSHGADPNLYDPDLTASCALWDLQYLYQEYEWKTRYEISKLFFQHGADPNLQCDGETLYDYIVFKVYEDTPNDENDWENLRHLYKLLVLYGGGGNALGYKKPELIGEIDMNRIDEYDIQLRLSEDGYHKNGLLVDGEENIVGIL